MRFTAPLRYALATSALWFMLLALSVGAAGARSEEAPARESGAAATAAMGESPPAGALEEDGPSQRFQEGVLKYGQLLNLLVVPLLVPVLQLAFRAARSTPGEDFCLLLFLMGHVFLWRAGLAVLGNLVPATGHAVDVLDGLLFLAYTAFGLAQFYRGRVRWLALRVLGAMVGFVLVSGLASAVFLKALG